MRVGKHIGVLAGSFTLACSSGGGDDGTANRSERVRCEDCNLDTQMERLADPAAEDCGETNGSDLPNAASACVESALTEGRPFRIVVVERGIDSAVKNGWLGSADGEIVQLSYDSDICGGGGDGCRNYDECGPRITAIACVNPSFVGTGPFIQCERRDHESVCEPG